MPVLPELEKVRCVPPKPTTRCIAAAQSTVLRLAKKRSSYPVSKALHQIAAAVASCIQASESNAAPLADQSMVDDDEHLAPNLAAIPGIELISLQAKSRQTRASSGRASADVFILKVQDVLVS